MELKAGIWIDQYKAVVVLQANGEERVIRFESHIPAHYLSLIRKRSFLQEGQSNVDAQRAAQYENQLHKYYKKVVFAVEEAEQIFIFGPDMARIELKKEMKKAKDRFAKIRGVERAEEMTEAQIVKKVRTFFRL